MGLQNNAQRQADILKDKGNLYFKKEKLGAAIEAYTEAITLCPSVPVYWTNRALCERKRNEWEKVEADCRKALELDSHSVKAYYMLGLALLQYQQYEEAVKQLEKALDLGRGATTGTYMVEEIWQELSKARLAEWEAASDVRLRQQVDLKLYLEQLLRTDYDKQLKEAVDCMKGAEAIGKAALEKVALEKVAPANEQVPSEDGALRDLGVGVGAHGDNEEKTVDDVGVNLPFMMNFLPDVSQLSRISRLYRTISEPSVISALAEQSVKATSSPFDPLKQHKESRSLRRGNSLSIRRQRSQIVPVDEEVLASIRSSPPETAFPDEKRGDQFAKPGSETRELEPAEPEIRLWDPRDDEPSQASAEERTHPVLLPLPYDMGPPDLQSGSIFDVFRVFKEFMKFHQHEASQKLLHAMELYQRRSKLLHQMFELLAEPDRLTEVPDHLCCKITMDIFRDPVITTSGITYERAAILDHLNKVGKFDPVTRIPLRPEQIVPNLAIKEAVQIYLNEHGWAYGPC